MMDTNPLVSVIMPVYNGAHFFDEAIASIRSQQYAPLEIIVVDDGSTDETGRLVQEAGPDVRSVYQENSGPAAARNRGLRLAQGELIAFLDVDDLWPAGKLKTQVGRLLDEPILDVVCGRIQFVHLPGAQQTRIHFEENNTLRHIHLGGAVFRRRAFEIVGPFDPTLRYNEDHDWFIRARERRLNIVILEQITLIYRLHDKNMTRDVDPISHSLLKVMKRSLDRRRCEEAGVAASLPLWSSFDESSRQGESL